MIDFLGDVFELGFMDPAVVCIGKFDAVHLGHQKLLEQAKMLALKNSIPLRVICFFPHPAVFFSKSKLKALTNVEERAELLKFYGVDQVVCLDFNTNLANLSAQSFMDDVLLLKLKAKFVVVGKDFRFGKSRLGGVEDLIAWGKKENVEVTISQEVFYDSRRISTSWCREVFENKNLLKQLLGRQSIFK